MTRIDVTKLSNFKKDMAATLRNGNLGEIYEINSLQDDPKGIVVTLYDGDHDRVIFLSADNDEQIKDDIGAEGQHTENKDSFYSDEKMQNKVIPLTIQSFFNSEGGRLYIGVQDGWVNGEPLQGLDFEVDYLRKNKQKDAEKKCKKEKKTFDLDSFEYSFADFRDDYEMAIRDKVKKWLSSSAELETLLHFKFPNIDGTSILQITVEPSTKPVFFKNWNTDNKEIECLVPLLNEKKSRKLDTFAYRTGNRKDYCETSESFFNYCVNHSFFIFKKNN